VKLLLRAIKDRLQGKVPLFGAPRSRHWPAVRSHWIRVNGECAACGAKTNLQVHHIKPFHLEPSLELAYTNLITLCETPFGPGCHLTVGHLGSFKNVNPTSVLDAADIRKAMGLPDFVFIIPVSR